MITVSPEFKEALRQPVKEVTGYLELEDLTQLTPGGILQKFTVESVGGFLRTAMSKITVTLKGNQAYSGSIVKAFFGVRIDGDWEYAQKGTFTFTDVKYDKTKDITVLIGYDNMYLFQIDYTATGTYPTTLYGYLQSICALTGVALENTEIYNGDLSVDEDYYPNVGGYTVRDVLEDVCEASASYAIINQFGNLELRQVEDTGEILTYDDLIKYELGDYWGGINSLVLSRQPQNDDVFIRDEVDINSPTTRNVLDLKKFNVGYKVGDS